MRSAIKNYKALLFTSPQREHLYTVMSLPALTSNFFSLSITHWWKPVLQSVFPLCLSASFGRLKGKILLITLFAYGVWPALKRKLCIKSLLRGLTRFTVRFNRKAR